MDGQSTRDTNPLLSNGCKKYRLLNATIRLGLDSILASAGNAKSVAALIIPSARDLEGFAFWEGVVRTLDTFPTATYFFEAVTEKISLRRAA
ncbi:hypothetical protein AB1L30_08755 [Bremerella sp. JC817]|uniref:hypothetical protein n=1 Tax=Bremerella sp. JC817 TaxID=3231756 RepID=UPI00345B171E